MGDRIDQHQQGRHIAAEALAGEAARLNPRGADQQHREDASRFDEAHHRMLQRQQAHGAVAGTAVQIDLLLKALLQPGLGSKGAHQGQAADRFSQQAGQFAHLLLTAFGRPHHPRPEGAHQHSHQGRQQHGGQRQLPIEEDHVAEHHDQLEQAGGGVLNRFVDHLGHPVGVFGEAVGEITGGEFLQGGELQTLQAGEQLAAQRLAHLQGRGGQQGVLAELGQLLHQKHQQGQADRPEHRWKITGADGGDQLAGQPGEQGPAGHKDHHADPAGDQIAAMGPEQRQQPAKTGWWGCEHRRTLSAPFRRLPGCGLTNSSNGRA